MLVTRGLGSPRSGNLVAAGLGLAVPADPNALRALLTGVGTLSATLGGVAYAQAFILGEGFLTAAVTGAVVSVGAIPAAIRVRAAQAMIRVGVAHE